MIPQTGLGRFLFFFHISLIIAQWLVPLAALPSLPDRIPVHFDFHGNPDLYAAKTGWELWFGAIMGTALGLFAMVLLRFPSSYNVPRKAEIDHLPPPQRARLHDILREMLLAIFVSVQGVMLALIALIISVANATNVQTPWVVIGLCGLAPLAIVIVYLVRISRAVDGAKREVGMA